MALLDVGKLLYYSFLSLEIPCTLQFNTFDSSSINVVLGYHLINDISFSLEYRYIIYQLEQLSDREGWFNLSSLGVMKNSIFVWDYSLDNILFLHSKGVKNTKLLPIGFHEKLETIVPSIPEVDVLFYGSTNHRRNSILHELSKDYNVVHIFGVYGEQRDAFIAKSRIIMNIHYYESQVMEQVRISYLLNNHCFVISEDSPNNPYLEGIISVPYEMLVDCCQYYIDQPEERYQIADEGYKFFQKLPMTSYLSKVL
ncbi:CgeB family protein [Anthocerotibacter panamensis]|uniref:hypothetical protein n=1 Tax=Anthocerotibacter panamensis TaxID=2857077 RepID=UPI001C4086F8|nr:hypothetical protein [Anthocerotibacter panamensis]